MSRTVAVSDNLVPEEILHAAGLSSVRLSDLVDGQGGDSFLPALSCTYCRAAERLSTQSPTPFDGVVFSNGCTATEKLFEVFARKSTLSLVTLLDAPKNDGERAIRFYSRRLAQLADTLVATYGAAVDDEALAEAIRLNNAFRSALRRRGVCRSRQLSGNALSLANLPDHIQKVNTLKAPEFGDAPRLLVAGTHLREVAWRDLVEAEGGRVSYFLTDDGDAYNQIDVGSSADGNLYDALARAYLSSMRSSFGRLSAVMTDPLALTATIREHDIQGIVLTQYSFCARAGYEAALLSSASELPNVPLLRLELNRSEALEAQVRTRIAAFLEMLRK